MPTGIRCERLGACWQGPNPLRQLNALRDAIGRGVNLIDNADVFPCGMSERLIGHALEWQRDDFLICTKVGRLNAMGRDRCRPHITGPSAAPSPPLDFSFAHIPHQ